MRVNIRDTSDPLDLSLLPPSQGMQLDYRTQPRGAGTDRAAAIYHIVATMVFSVVVVIICRAAAASLKAANSPLYSVALLFWSILYPCIGLVALVLYLRGKPVRDVLSLLATPPILWGLLHLITAGYNPLSTYLVIFIPAMLLAIWTSDRVLLHYAAWMVANPMLDPATRRKWQALTRSRIPQGLDQWWTKLCRLSHRSQDRPSGHEAELITYPLAAFCLVVALFVSFIIFGLSLISPELRAFAGMLAIFALFALLLAARPLWNYYAQLPVLPSRLVWLVAWRALANWSVYNAHQTAAPGVFQSPTGPCDRRLWLWEIAVFLLTLSILPVSGYFPVVPFVVGPTTWLGNLESSNKATTPATLSPEEVQRTLKAPEQLRYRSLETEEEKQKFLAHIAQRRANLSQLVLDRKQREAALTDWATTPEKWVVLAMGRAFTLDYLSAAAFFLALFLCLIAGPMAFFLVFVFLAGRLLAIQYLALETADAPEQTRGLSLWDARVARLRTSLHEIPADETTVREADHLWLGTSTINDYPILLDRHILGEHAHILGSSGSGKTTIGLAPLIAQLIRHQDCSVIVIDLKGDPALFTGAREEAQAAGLPFKWFTDQLGCSTYAFNPMLQSHHPRVTLRQRTELLMGAFGLKYGRFYARDYFSDMQDHLLFQALRYQPDCPSFAHLYNLLRNRRVYQGMSRKQLDDASHIWKIVDRLASFPALNACPAHGSSSAVLNNAINLDDYFKSPGVAYFYLVSANQSVSVAEIARLALYTALTVATTKPKDHPPVYIIIDEFQQIVSSNLEIILRHARSMGIGVILANQTLPDLDTPDIDLVPIIYSNTRFKQIFSANDVFQQEYLSKASGEAIYELVSHSESESTSSYGTTYSTGTQNNEHIGPRIRVNDIIEFSNHPGRCLVHVNRGRGFSQFGGYSFVMACKHHITRKEYERRDTAPWPPPNEGTIVPDAQADAAAAQSSAQADRRACAEETFEQITFEGLQDLLDDAKKDEGLFNQPPPPEPKPERPPRKRKKGKDQDDTDNRIYPSRN